MAVMLSALLTGRALLPRKMIFSVSGTHFCWRLKEPQGLVRPEWVGELEKKIINLIGSRTSDLAALATMLPGAPDNNIISSDN
jgi:hypothetical protein